MKIIKLIKVDESNKINKSLIKQVFMHSWTFILYDAFNSNITNKRIVATQK